MFVPATNTKRLLEYKKNKDLQIQKRKEQGLPDRPEKKILDLRKVGGHTVRLQYGKYVPSGNTAVQGLEGNFFSDIAKKISGAVKSATKSVTSVVKGAANIILPKAPEVAPAPTFDAGLPIDSSPISDIVPAVLKNDYTPYIIGGAAILGIGVLAIALSGKKKEIPYYGQQYSPYPQPQYPPVVK